ncbi:MAG: type I DNA topoisomerase [Bacteroidetes bacterium]|nr:type I DNA topoisomerase [Bacteroidota bacterium]MBU1677960.1 type I DNA topoisomerase [Bacteroidota bacterium]MBU2506977.1 type I DNA topoisomerase [Bacteroidota bacterium]
MIKNLVIVESPAKAKTIEGFLGKDFKVASSYGHIRDLEKKNFGIDIKNNFQPNYIVPEEKKHVVKELKKLVKESEVVWLATDEDREGEAISWHLKEVLGLESDLTKRIVFHEITKRAITEAITNARTIDQNLVEAQQARRILDRLVGFELSPILWRKIKPSLSAGRVQSVAVRLVVERERDIDAFTAESQYRVVGEFIVSDENGKESKLKAELSKKFKTKKEAEDFLKKCGDANFTITNLEKKLASKSPSAPFTTSTLQQEASRKLGFSLVRTMLVAQKLYEAGKITYMRTDSVNLSEQALQNSSDIIQENFGKEYLHTRQYKTKSASAQEAHEAIRPSYFENASVDGGRDEKVLYELIWKRAIASQMSDAKLERTTAKISISNSTEQFVAKGEVIKFDGFLKVYLESSDDESRDNGVDVILPPLHEGQNLTFEKITATERYSRPPARYTEASLVKKLEELGIGRPSTYAPTISTIQKRGYVHKDEREGFERNYTQLTLSESGKIVSNVLTERTGADKNKLVPEDIAMLVNDFLLENFPNILDYQFTAGVEKELDDIAEGRLNWTKMLGEFYHPFHEKVEHTIENSERVSGERILGIEEKSGKQVSVRMARFGPVAQLTNTSNPEDKPQYAGLRKTQKLEYITLEEALDLFKLPRTLGEFEDAEVVAAIGRFGPYIRRQSKFYSLGKDYDPYTVTLDEAIIVIEEKRVKDAEKTIKIFEENPDYQILNGRWGPYLKAGKKNVKLPKNCDFDKITLQECIELAEKAPVKKGRGRK